MLELEKCVTISGRSISTYQNYARHLAKLVEELHITRLLHQEQLKLIEQLKSTSQDYLLTPSLSSFIVQKDQVEKTIGTTFGSVQHYVHAGGYELVGPG